MRIGVTGHRHIDDPGASARAIDAVIGELDRRTDDRLELCSSLAEGADRMAVSSVPARARGTRVAVLPLPPADYAADFRDVDSPTGFDELLARSATVHMTGPDADGSRESASERAGMAAVDAIDVLIAVWDGTQSRGRGGTAEIVGAARDRGVEVVVVPVTGSIVVT